jgi:TerB-C domain
LSVSRHTLYAGLHEGIGAATKAASEPVLVSDAVLEPLHEILHPGSESPDDASEHLARIQTDFHEENTAATSIPSEPILVSAAVPELLHKIPRPTTEPADDTSERLARIREETDRVAALLKSIFVEEELEPTVLEPADETTHAGLDAEHALLLTRLLTRSEWPRGEFDMVASEAGMMPGGAMETINEWAFDYYGDALLEDGDPVVINHSLLPVEAEVASAE